jgi:CO/xanthine dehydrogenase Mo-binding subunit
MPDEWVRCNPAQIGGEFGGKGSLMDAPVAYHLARRTGQPVRMVMTYTEELTAGNPRHPSVIRLRTGVKSDGRLWARASLAVWDSGAYGAHKPIPTVHLLGGHEAAGPYRIPNLRMDSRCVYTNKFPCGFMRAPGQPQMVFAFESQMDIIAHELGIDPVELRLRNVIQEGDQSGRGQRYHHLNGPATLRAAVEAGDYGKPKPTPYVGRGLAFADHGIGGGPSGIVLGLHPDGQIDVRYGVPDQGVGLSVMLRQVVAETLGLPVEQIAAIPSDTDVVPHDAGAAASRHTHVAGLAGLQAAEQLGARLVEAAAALLGAPPDAVERRDGQFLAAGRAVSFAQVAERAAGDAGGRLEVRVEVNLPIADQNCFTAQVAEVEVDPETGQVRLRRLVTAQDVGTIINPLTHQGQIDGGVVQGIGQALMEEIAVDDGRVLTANLGEYKLPTIADIPPHTTLLVDSGAGPGPFGSKAIGEMSLLVPPAAIANAIYDACGVRLFSLPLTAEQVWRALHARDTSRD